MKGLKKLGRIWTKSDLHPRQVAAVRRAIHKRMASLKLTVYAVASDWAAKHYVLPRQAGSIEGVWEPPPYQSQMVDIMAVTPGPRIVVVKKSARIGYTEGIKCLTAYNLSEAGRHTTIYQPNDHLARAWAKKAIDPMIESVEPLAEMVDLDQRVRTARGSYRPGTMVAKQLNGYLLRILGAKSPSNFRESTDDVVILDELDGYSPDVGGEGDPVFLAQRSIRTSPFGRLVVGSTPTDESSSQIEVEWRNCAPMQFEFYVPCPVCGELGPLEWDALWWDDVDKDVPMTTVYAAQISQTVRYKPKCCFKERGKYWYNRQLKGVLEGGRFQTKEGWWIDCDGLNPPRLMQPDGEEAPAWPNRIGLFIWSAYSTWYPWSDIPQQMYESWGDASKMKTWRNHYLGLVYNDSRMSVSASVEERRMRKKDPIPARAQTVVASVDVQAGAKDGHDGWLSVLVVAFGPGSEAWVLERIELPGTVDTRDGTAWGLLSEWIKSKPVWKKEGGELPLGSVVIDSGYSAHVVYEVAQRMPFKRILPVRVIKGSPNVNAPFIKRKPTLIESENGRQVKLYNVGVSSGKDVVVARTNRDPHVVHFCYDVPEEVFSELQSEIKQPVTRSGRITYRWIQKEKRNEALDCYSADTEVLTESGWKLFPDVTMDDSLATVNLGRDELQYRRPTHVIHKDLRGDMVRIKSRSVDLLVTPGHRMVVHRTKRIDGAATDRPPATFSRADSLLFNDGLKRSAANWRGRDSSKVRVSGKLVDSEDWARFLGLYAAEGTRITGKPGSANPRIRNLFVACRADNEYRDSVEEICSRIPWNSCPQPSGITIYGKDLHRAIGRAVGDYAHAKRVPDWVKRSSQRIIRAYLNGHVLGDGWYDRSNGRTICTTSKLMADDLHELFIKIGRNASIRSVPPRKWSIKGSSGTTRTQYHVREIRVRTASMNGVRDGKRVFLPEVERYDGTVHCATVPNGTLVVRRNGKSVVCGNCLVYAFADIHLHNPPWLATDVIKDSTQQRDRGAEDQVQEFIDMMRQDGKTAEIDRAERAKIKAKRGPYRKK